MWTAATYPWVHEGHPRKLGDRNIADVEHHDSLAACFALELRDAVYAVKPNFGALCELSVVGASSRLRFLSRLRAGAGFRPAATLRPPHGQEDDRDAEGHRRGRPRWIDDQGRLRRRRRSLEVRIPRRVSPPRSMVEISMP